MRIALIGVPGSGKSDLAKQVCEAVDDKVYVVDDYVDGIEKRVGLALGVHATYVGNLHVALDRIALERKAKRRKHVITIGTLFETAAYTAISFEKDAKLATSDEDHLTNARRIEAAMRTFACLFMDTYLYDHAFYLPCPTPSGNDDYELDRSLQVAMDSFKLAPVVKLEGPHDVQPVVDLFGS